MTADIRPGDHVYWGKPTRQSVHWQVQSVDESDRMTVLFSGQTGRHAYNVPLEVLTLHPSSLNERSIA